MCKKTTSSTPSTWSTKEINAQVFTCFCLFKFQRNVMILAGTEICRKREVKLEPHNASLCLKLMNFPKL
nr:hypothetical protein [Tanacetum cinerariifolium]